MSRPSCPRSPNRSSITSRGSDSTSFTPSVWWCGVRPRQQPGLLGQERVDAVAGDHHGCRDDAAVAVGAYPGDPAGGVADQAGRHGRGEQLGAGGHRVVGEPAVEVGAVDRHPVVRRPPPRLAAVVEAQRLRRRHHHRRAADHPALDRHLLPPAGDQRRRAPGRRPRRRRRSSSRGTGRARAARPTVRPGRVRARPPSRPARRRPRPRRPATSGCGARVSSRVSAGPARRCRADGRVRASRSRASVTRPRSAIAVIGQDGSVLTLTTCRGAPRPPTCWLAPETPSATYRSGAIVTPVVPICRS